MKHTDQRYLALQKETTAKAYTVTKGQQLWLPCDPERTEQGARGKGEAQSTGTLPSPAGRGHTSALR